MSAPEAAPICPTSCDEDCEVLCHETHAVRWRRDHDPEQCPTHPLLLAALGDALTGRPS